MWAHPHINTYAHTLLKINKIKENLNQGTQGHRLVVECLCRMWKT